MSKTKKILINIGCAIFVLVFGFCTGRFIRFGGISGTSEQLVSGIILERDTTDRILDELSIARSAGNSTTDTGQAILRGIQELSKSNETAKLCISEIEREIELAQQNAKTIKQSFESVSDAIDYGWRITENQALAYERIVDTLQQFNNNSTKNEQESITGSWNSQ